MENQDQATNANQSLAVDCGAVKAAFETDGFVQTDTSLLKPIEPVGQEVNETIDEAVAAMEMEEEFDADQAAQECGCGEEHLSPSGEITSDAETMLFDMVTDLQARVTELERRVVEYNKKASHKL